MVFRLVLVAALLLVQSWFHGEARAEPATGNPATEKPATEKNEFSPKLIIYLAKGRADSCGPGCDRWIAVEGEVDSGAAARIRRFLRDVKDTQRPIYFHSPGGSVEQSFAIGRLLRNRKAIARVGRTIVTACAAGSQVDDACLKTKTGGGEIEAEIATRNAMCNSACSYLFFGATTREVAPDAGVVVHDSRLTLFFHGHPTPAQVAEFKARDLLKADRERTSYLHSMGISPELEDLIRTVKFENRHLLTRAELYRFGIDTRPFAETLWTLETSARPFVRKIAVAKQDDGTSFRSMDWRLFCENKDRARLMFVQEFDKGAAGKSRVVMTAGSEKPVAFGSSPARVGDYQIWSSTIAPDPMKTILAAPHLQMGEATSTPDGKDNLSTFEIDTSGLEPAWTELLGSCPAPTVALPATAAPDLASAPAP
jgi:hypothetical protein